MSQIHPIIGSENISIIIECKKETISAKDKKDGVGQMQSYMASCPNTEWGMWTNGKEKYMDKSSTISSIVAKSL